MLGAVLSGLFFAFPSPADAAQERLARLYPQDSQPRFEPKGEDLVQQDGLAEDETLTVASEVYSLWAAQLAVLISADESPRAWQQFMGLGPTLTQAYRQLGLAAWDKGDLVESARLLKKAHVLDPKDGEVTRKLGYAYKQIGQYELGLDLLFLSSVETPEDHLVWLWLGDAQRLVGQYEEAYESMLMARDLAPVDQSTELQSFVDYTMRLGEETPSWDNFETHRDFAARHQTTGRVRRFIFEYARALEVAPEEGVTEVDALQRKAYTNQEIGIQYTFLKEHDIALDYYARAANLYAQAGAQLDSARNLNNMADAYRFLADREWLDTTALRALAIEYRREAFTRSQQSGDAQYVRYVQGRLMSDLLHVHPHTAAEVEEIRSRNLRELPRTGPIPDFSLAAVADGEIAYRLADNDLAGARIMIEMVLPYYEQSEYLEDSERAAYHFVDLAHIFHAQEHYQEAIRQAEKALDILASMRELMVPDAFNRSGALDTHRRAATLLVRAFLAMDEPIEALKRFEQYQAQTRQDMLGSAAGGLAEYNEFDTERLLIEQRLPALQESLDAARSSGDMAVANWMETRVTADTKRLEWLQRDITLPRADELQLSFPQVREPQDLLDAWPAEVTLVGYLTDDYGTVALLVAGNKVQGFLMPEATEEALNQHATTFAASIDGKIDGAEARSALATLLLSPIQEALSTEIVYVVTSNVMNDVPFEALATDSVVEKHAIAYTQSANLLLSAVQETQDEKTAQLAFSPDADASSAARAAEVLPAAEILSAEAATETRLKNLGDSVRTVHIAAKADVHHPDVMLNALALATDDANDGLLHAAELLGGSMPVDLVTLDLDYEGTTDQTSGMRLGGLIDGFLHAGVDSLVINLWTAQEAPAAFFLKAFYENLTTMEKLAAFHAAQLATRAQFPDPAQWAAFTLRGAHR
jgi:CHAT domain-containing protein/tetratricopeptide (TPR) repeat protein